jgi:hypothetical protein
MHKIQNLPQNALPVFPFFPEQTVNLQINKMIVVLFATAFDAFKSKSQTFGNIAAPGVANSAFYLYPVHIHFFKGIFDKYFTGRRNQSFALISGRYPITDFEFFVDPINFFKADEAGDFVVKTNRKNQFL